MTSDLTVTTTSCNTDVIALPTQRGVHFPTSWHLGLVQVKGTVCYVAIAVSAPGREYCQGREEQFKGTEADSV